MTRRRFLYGYFPATLTSWCVMAVSQYCFEWQNAHQLSNPKLRDTRISIWLPSSFGVVALLVTNPWTVILFTIIRGGPLS